MELRLCLGLVLLIGWGNTQGPAFSENSTEEQQWPKLEILKYLQLSCKPTMLNSNIPSVSVNKLRPSDVKCVASIGIEGTLSFPSTVVMKKQNRTEERPQDLCLGVGTDIIRFFNPTVLRPLCIPRRKETSQNDAEYLWLQATELVRSMKENVQLDFERDWKLINIFISNADKCHLCSVDGQNNFVKSTMNKLTKTLDYLYQEVPRSFVNLVDITEFFFLPEMKKQDSNNPESCRCSEEMTQYKAVAWRSYQETFDRVLASSKYSQNDSFALVLHSFFYETEQSPLLMDWSLEDSNVLGVHLWNSMMDPAREKESQYTAIERRVVKCPPKEHPYLFTYKNRNYQPRLPKTRPVLQRQRIQLQCPDKTPSWIVPQSVHKLKPADIKVVAAVGDTLMANAGVGFRPQNFSVFNEHQYLSWSSLDGNKAMENAITLPNILHQFNPKLIDYTLGHGNIYNTGAKLDQTVSGIISMDMSNQVSEVIRKMKKDRKINYKNDWKLLTMFVGVNDLCHSCTEKLIFSPESFQNNIKSALDILHREVPRIIVNVVSPLEIISLRAIYKETGYQCPQDQLMKLCPCVMEFGEGSKEHAQVVMYNKKYQEAIEVMVKSGRYDTRDDFTVVLQPFFERFEVPRTEEGLPDLTYFDLDCFHFSQKALGHAASALWNNMLEPMGHKTRQHNFTGNIVFTCPTKEQPFLRTSRNSIQTSRILQCQDMSPSSIIPSTVHALKPADIKVIAALGDSLTSGKGAGAVTYYPSSYEFLFRGLSFSIGGDRELPYVKTLPNILRKFNSDIKGFSLNVSESTEETASLNVAKPGQLSKNFLTQAKDLVTKMKTMRSINFTTDWKVITVMIGYQDFCEFCKSQKEYTAEKFLKYVRNTLDYLHDNVPRALVNLLYFFEPLIIRQVFQTQPKICLNEYSSQCSCILAAQESTPQIISLEKLTVTYRNSLNNLVWSGRYDKFEDFTVVLQPFLQTVTNTFLMDGKADISFLTPDCLNLNQKAHGKLAYALWNNMFEALGNKTQAFNFRMSKTLTCPGDKKSSTFFRTRKNSNYKYPNQAVQKDWGSDFLCEYLDFSPEIPTSVHKLQPADIEVVAAMGDWVTTAQDSNPYIFGQARSWKSVSWSIGGHENLEIQTTLPNILLKFTSVLRGISFGSWPELAGLNVAEEDARAENMPEQAFKLLERIELNPEIDINNDWKLITIFIGINDLCDFCKNKTADASKRFYKYIRRALDIFYQKLPRVFINLVEIMDVISFFERRGGKCSKLPQKCPCFDVLAFDSELREELKKTNTKFQKELNKLSMIEEHISREDFVVVTQPFFRASSLPREESGLSDPSYFSENCLHFSSLMQNEMAIALWNNMLERVGEKTTSYNFTNSRTKLKCPSKDRPYFSTPRNSVQNWFIWILALGIVLLFSLMIIISIVQFFRRIPSTL